MKPYGPKYSWNLGLITLTPVISPCPKRLTDILEFASILRTQRMAKTLKISENVKLYF